MPEFFLAKHENTLIKTKEFLFQYLSRKERNDGDVYLSFYFSRDDAAQKGTRDARFMKLLRSVEQTLKSQLSARQVDVFMKQIDQLNPFELINEKRFSLAFFITEKFAGFLLLPFEVYETVVVAQSLHLKPVLSWIKYEDQFFIAIVTDQKCQLLKGNGTSLIEVCSIKAGKQNAIVDLAAAEFLNIILNSKLPLLLGGKEEILGEFKDRCAYDNIFSEPLKNVDSLKTEELHKECLHVLNSICLQRDQEILAKYRNPSPEDKIIRELKEIIVAAVQGRVQNLLVASDRFVWGSFDNSTGKMNRYIDKNFSVPEDDILDDLAEIVIARGGTVTVLKHNDIPSDSDALALLK